MNELKRHPLAVAWDKWLESEEGKKVANPDTLGSHAGPYLENRLRVAFMAGTQVMETVICDEIVIALNQYRCTYFIEGDDPELGSKLVDVFTPEGRSSIKTGEEELDALVDHVCGSVIDVFRTMQATRTVSPAVLDSDGTQPSLPEPESQVGK